MPNFIALTADTFQI